MYVQKNFTIRGLLSFIGHHIIWLSVWMSFVTGLYIYTDWKWLFIPWLPVSLIGTAVAFYVGFKNNQAYDRLWEARKIWGGIVNSSRSFGSAVRAYISDQFSNEKLSNSQLVQIHRKILYRHIAWLYVLRDQLLVPTSWEHINQGFGVGRITRIRFKRFGKGLVKDENIELIIKNYLNPEEYNKLSKDKNAATQLIDKQSQVIKKLREEHLTDDFRHMEMQKILNEFYAHQGKCERIKKFPLPRQYGSMSVLFIGIFIFLLPFGIVAEFAKLGDWGMWLSVPVMVLVSLVYLIMELVGDYSENPFEGMGNDIPMLSLCRTIEIDLKQMLDETDLPDAIKPIHGVLM